MSDYLWDGTGEVDAEVERLEKLLGGLRHQPRALELPPAARVEQKPRLLFNRPALAAAAVALMLLAGAVFVASRAGRVAQRLAGAPPRPAPQEMIKTEETPSAATDREPPDARVAEKGKDERKPERQGAALAPVITKRRGGAATYTASRNTRRKNAPAHAARDMTPPDGVLAVVRQRQQEAKEQLIYALRLTGAKLNEVQAKVRSADEGKSLYEERNKIK